MFIFTELFYNEEEKTLHRQARQLTSCSSTAMKQYMIPGKLVIYIYIYIHLSIQYLHYVCAQSLSHLRLSATPWIVTHQASLSMGLSWWEYWSVLPCPPPRDLPDWGIEPMFPVIPALAGRFFTTEPLGKPYLHCMVLVITMLQKLHCLQSFCLYSA